MPFPRHLGDSLTFADLQQQSQEWREANFGPEDRSPMIQVLGCMEELGELAHAEQKHQQGIRGLDNQEEFEGLATDAVGDLLIYLAGYCSERGFSMQDAAENAWAQVRNRDWKANPTDGST